LPVFVLQPNYASVVDLHDLGRLAMHCRHVFGSTLLALIFGCILVIIVSDRPKTGFSLLLESRGLTVIGKYSYGIYVFHVIILGIGVQVVMPKLWPGLTFVSDFIMKPITGLLDLLLSLAVAWCSYHCYEKHFLALKRFFADSQEPSLRYGHANKSAAANEAIAIDLNA
jgi:peptidoglycan/LPS O-acetylase OafA/YrhL